MNEKSSQNVCYIHFWLEDKASRNGKKKNAAMVARGGIRKLEMKQEGKNR
jgi:hypothetical protein